MTDKTKQVEALVSILRELIGKEGRVKVRIGDKDWVVCGGDNYYEIEQCNIKSDSSPR